MGCKEFAVIAYWDLDLETELFECSRFFVAPSPMKRIVADSDGTKLSQVLYTSTHNKDVFFFFKGHDLVGGDDLDEVNDYSIKL